MKTRRIVAIIALAFVARQAQAALHDRGGGLLYDDVLNVTWLQDASYAYSSHPWGMSVAEANDWAANLVYYDSVRGVKYRDWRLPRNSPVGSDWNYDFSYDGSTDYSYNITSPKSELAYMYYVNLDLKGKYSPSGDYQADWGILGNGTYGWWTDVGLVKNLTTGAYWSGAAYAPRPTDCGWGCRRAWAFSFTGWQIFTIHVDVEPSTAFAWAVRDGDVRAVPEPETYATLLTGLAALGALASRGKR